MHGHQNRDESCKSYHCTQQALLLTWKALTLMISALTSPVYAPLGLSPTFCAPTCRHANICIRVTLKAYPEDPHLTTTLEQAQLKQKRSVAVLTDLVDQLILSVTDCFVCKTSQVLLWPGVLCNSLERSRFAADCTPRMQSILIVVV